MSATREPLRIGSIIRLESTNAKSPKWEGGFLQALGPITDIPVITVFHDPHVRTLVTTYLDENPSRMENRWQILSADGSRKEGDLLASGDKIYLLNMLHDVGYLDTFEWVINLKPFAAYGDLMNIGVFTSDSPNRDGGASATWTIVALDQKNGQPIYNDDLIYLVSDYPGAGALSALSERGKSATDLEYNSQKLLRDKHYQQAKKFVFTGAIATTEQFETSASWRISLSSSVAVESLYRFEQQWGADPHAPWHDAGIFQIGSHSTGRLQSLELAAQNSEDYVLEGSARFVDDPNEYRVSAKPNRKRSRFLVSLETSLAIAELKNHAPHEWLLGSREEPVLVGLTLKLNDQGQLEGQIQYRGEPPIRLRTSREQDSQEIIYDFLRPDVLRGRTQRIKGLVDTTYNLIAESQRKFDTIERQSDSQALAEVDFDFQAGQLANLGLVNEQLHSFYRERLLRLMKQSYKNHRADQSLAPLDLIRQSFQELVSDYMILQQAAIQRQWTHGLDPNANSFMSEQAMNLLMIDKLAQSSIAPFKKLLPKENLAIISYLSEKTHLRHLPYTDQVLLLGISYDSISQEGGQLADPFLSDRAIHNFELMAIPHEIGHYIYGHGKLEDGRSFREVAKQFANNQYYRWSEELFSDLYGCIVTGPLTVLSMRAMLVSTNRERAWKDDELHPSPVLRIFLVNEMLRILNDIRPANYSFPNVLDKLDDDWTSMIESWGYAPVEQSGHGRNRKRPARIYMHDSSAIQLEQIVNLDRVIYAVRPIIIEFAKHLLSNLDPNSLDTPWVKADQAALQASSANTRDLFNPYIETVINKTSRRFACEPRSESNRITIERGEKQSDLSAHSHEPEAQLSPDEQLLAYLLDWGDKGPYGWGGHDLGFI
jgi:hypothetical protein